MPLYDNSLKEVCKDFFRQLVGIFWFCWLFASSWLLPAGWWLVLSLLGVVSILPLPRYSGGFRFLVLPPAGYFPAMESNQRSPGLRPRPPRRGEIRSIPFPADAENCIALLCPSFSPPDPLRWAPAGAPRGGGGIGTGLASPLAATRRFSLRPQHFGHWPLGRISPLQDLAAVALPSAVLMPPFGLPSST